MMSLLFSDGGVVRCVLVEGRKLCDDVISERLIG